MHQSSSCAAQFHLKDGRPLVFHTVPQSLFRRRAGEIMLFAALAAAGLVAATLLAKGRSDPPNARVPPARSASRAR
jgi:hypothetical protein